MDAVASEGRIAASDGAGADERIVAALLERGRLKDADLARVRRVHDEAGGSLLALLGRLGLLSERDHAEACTAVLGLPLRSARDLPDLPPEGTNLGLRSSAADSGLPPRTASRMSATTRSPSQETK